MKKVTKQNNNQLYHSTNMFLFLNLYEYGMILHTQLYIGNMNNRNNHNPNNLLVLYELFIRLEIVLKLISNKNFDVKKTINAKTINAIANKKIFFLVKKTSFFLLSIIYKL